MHAQLVMWLVAAAAGTVLLSFCADWFVEKRRMGRRRSRAYRVAASVITILFAFLTALQLTDANRQLDAARMNTYAEGSALRDLYLSAGHLPHSVRDQIRQQVVDYTHYMLDREWPELAQNGHIPDEGWQQIDELEYTIGALDPQSAPEQRAVDRAADAVHEIYTTRRTRAAQLEHTLPEMLLAGLVGTSLIMLSLMIFEVASRAPADLVAMVLATIAVIFMVYLVVKTNHPYVGEISVNPSPFTDALNRFQNISAPP